MPTQKAGLRFAARLTFRWEPAPTDGYIYVILKPNLQRELCKNPNPSKLNSPGNGQNP